MNILQSFSNYYLYRRNGWYGVTTPIEYKTKIKIPNDGL